MIDFSQYSEVDPFTTPILDSTYSKHIDYDFKELPFNDKRKKYIDFLDKSFNKLIQYLERGAAGFASIEDTNLKNQFRQQYEAVQNLLELFEIKPSDYFDISMPIDQSANCLGTDRVYSMYRNFINITSIVQGLYTYEEYYEVCLKDAFHVSNQIFNKIGTRGQFYGYLDQQVKGFGDLMDNYSEQLKNSADDWKLLLDIGAGFSTNLTTQYNSFVYNITTAGQDMRQLINPIIKFLNMVELGGDIFTASWGSFSINQKLANINKEYSKNIIGFEDYFAECGGNTYQITEQMLERLNEDKSNIEFILTKATSLSLTDYGIRTKLEQIHNEIIIPNY